MMLTAGLQTGEVAVTVTTADFNWNQWYEPGKRTRNTACTVTDRSFTRVGYATSAEKNHGKKVNKPPWRDTHSCTFVVYTNWYTCEFVISSITKYHLMTQWWTVKLRQFLCWNWQDWVLPCGDHEIVKLKNGTGIPGSWDSAFRNGNA